MSVAEEHEGKSLVSLLISGELQGGVCFAGIWLCLSPVFFTMLPLLPMDGNIYIFCAIVCWNVIFDFIGSCS